MRDSLNARSITQLWVFLAFCRSTRHLRNELPKNLQNSTKYLHCSIRTATTIFSGWLLLRMCVNDHNYMSVFVNFSLINIKIEWEMNKMKQHWNNFLIWYEVREQRVNKYVRVCERIITMANVSHSLMFVAFPFFIERLTFYVFYTSATHTDTSTDP